MRGRGPATSCARASTPAAVRQCQGPAWQTNLMDELAPALSGGDLVFTSSTGQPLRSPNFLRRVWKPAVADVGLGDLVPHDLRHTAASLAISAGASVKAVQRMVGHSSAQITLDRYAHLFEDDLDSLAESMDARYGAARCGQVRPKRTSGNVVDLPRTPEGRYFGLFLTFRPRSSGDRAPVS
jgi:hypothetical protein